MAVDQATQNAFVNVVAPFQAGVLAGAQEWAQELRTHALTSKDLLPDAVTAWQRIVRHPNEQMAQGFAETTMDETFGFGRMFRLPRNVEIPRDPRGLPQGGKVTTIVQDTMRSIPWSQAFSHYARSSTVVKVIVPAAVRVAKRGRRLQHQLLEIISRKNKPH